MWYFERGKYYKEIKRIFPYVKGLYVMNVPSLLHNMQKRLGQNSIILKNSENR